MTNYGKLTGELIRELADICGSGNVITDRDAMQDYARDESPHAEVCFPEAVVKPESEAALAEIAKLLKNSPEITAFIVGHTDMTGSLEHNIDLSNRRAAAVIEALVTHHGISTERLAPRGIGPLAPIGSNDTEAGRALNRRVELVKK